jgi:NAD(P)-dependent dehydrogenase (short-subunit alcohol dehydrogenase family)
MSSSSAPSAHDALLRLFDLAGRGALVTGGSVSIGRAIALGLASAGADVAIHYSPSADATFGLPNAAVETTDQISPLPRKTAAIAADFLIHGQATRTVKEAVSAIGRVDILVICASIQSRKDFQTVTGQDVSRQFAINFASTVELLQAALPAMVDRRWGRVLSIGSVNQTRPETPLSVYAALKAAQHNLIVNLARRHAADGVTLNTLSPGLVATERNRWRRTDPSEWEAIQKRANPMERAGRPEEMIGPALLLCSDAGSFITGADLQATGGGHL